jgi:hypothetical protein
MRKILFFQWNAFMQKGIERAFTYLGMEYDTFYYIFKDWDKDDDFKEKFKKRLQSCQKRISYYKNISLVLYFVYEEDSHKSTKHILPVNHCILLKSKVKNLPKKHIHILLFQIAAFF